MKKIILFISISTLILSQAYAGALSDLSIVVKEEAINSFYNEYDPTAQLTEDDIWGLDLRSPGSAMECLTVVSGYATVPCSWGYRYYSEADDEDYTQYNCKEEDDNVTIFFLSCVTRNESGIFQASIYDYIVERK